MDSCWLGALCRAVGWAEMSDFSWEMKPQPNNMQSYDQRAK